MSKRVKDYVENTLMCACKQRPITQRWPGGFCEPCGHKYYVKTWIWICECAEWYVDPNYPEDVERLKHAVYNLAKLGEKVPIQAVQMLRKLGVEVSDLVREYGGVA